MQFSLLQHENNFLKTEINQKQKAIDKLLDLSWLQSKDQYKVNDNNKIDKKMLKCHGFKMQIPQGMLMMAIRNKVTQAEDPKTIIYTTYTKYIRRHA